MISEKETTRISKFLSLVLRHKPDTIGIELDENGWTDVAVMINKINQTGLHINFEMLKHVVDTNPKKRFAFNLTFDKIRANQGHSVDVELGYVSQQPPAVLYHGTSTNTMDAILKNGLQKMDRHHVHLSADVETAIKVGQRHGKPFIFAVRADEMFQKKYEFYQSDNGVWLTDHVPANFLVPVKQDDQIL
jgi:putative RNA 2'-phosphotransferase